MLCCAVQRWGRSLPGPPAPRTAGCTMAGEGENSKLSVQESLLSPNFIFPESHMVLGKVGKETIVTKDDQPALVLHWGSYCFSTLIIILEFSLHCLSHKMPLKRKERGGWRRRGPPSSYIRDLPEVSFYHFSGLQGAQTLLISSENPMNGCWSII